MYIFIITIIKMCISISMYVYIIYTHALTIIWLKDSDCATYADPYMYEPRCMGLNCHVGAQRR